MITFAHQPLPFKTMLSAFGISLVTLAAIPGSAQVTPPPPFNASSPDGVNYRSGSFSYSDTDLSIGGPGTEGLSLVRHYSSAVDVPTDIYFAARGWTHSLQGYVSNAPDPQNPDDPPPSEGPGSLPYTYTVTVGNRSATFHGGSVYQANISTTGGPVGVYFPVSTPNTALVFNGTTGAGYYTFTDTDGTVVNFNTGASGYVANMIMPDGTRWDWTYTSGQRIKSVISNRGWAILIDSNTKACAVNMAQTYITATSTCPTDAQTVTYGYTAGVYSWSASLLTSATKNGNTTTYSYVGADHLGCIKRPGESSCYIQNSYAVCPNDPTRGSSVQPDVRMKDPVILQTDAAGRTVKYDYANNYEATNPNDLDGHLALCNKYLTSDPDYFPFRDLSTKITVNSSASRSVLTEMTGNPLSITNELGRTTALGFDFPGVLSMVGPPEGNKIYYVRDLQGHLLGTSMLAKPGSGLTAAQTIVHYPSSCPNPKVCGKPDYVIDPDGNRVDYTYDPTHGMTLTEAAPADPNGVRAVKRYAYIQRYAWIKNASGGYSHASSPVWLLSEVRTCRSSATVIGACAAGPSDEIVTSYEYGPDTGAVGNNLQLRGTAVTAYSGTTAVTYRTCVSYDARGNQISQTSPRANLTVCP